MKKIHEFYNNTSGIEGIGTIGNNAIACGFINRRLEIY